MEQTVSATVELYRAVHSQLREEVQDLDQVALNWAPGPETNSIGVLVTHLLGSEREVLSVVRGLPSDRDRDAEFRVETVDAANLIQLLDRADAFLEESGGQITASDLAATRPRPPRPPQTGLHWLLSNYGHAREHLGHVQLTKQLYEQHRRRQ